MTAAGEIAVQAPGSSGDTEAQLTKLRAEVAALREQLRRAQRLATVGTMAAMVAHEFNNILTPIISYAQLARKNPDLAIKAIDRAADGGRRATSIAKAILGITRDEDREAESFRVAEVVEQTLDAIARRPQSDHIDLTLDVPADLTVLSRRAEVQQVLLNLVLNARSAVLARSSCRRIEISARRSSQGVAIRVRDNGVGIAPENLQRIFQPFYSTKGSDDAEDGGHGLGLTVCQEIVTDLGGTISVESAPDQGATFTVRLPG